MSRIEMMMKEILKACFLMFEQVYGNAVLL